MYADLQRKALIQMLQCLASRRRIIMAQQIDKETQQIVKRAWNGLMGYYSDELRKKETGEGYWIDIEDEPGFLKDIDALNALIEPYMLDPTSFVELPIKNEKIYNILNTILSRLIMGESSVSGNEIEDFCGFIPEPYIYARFPKDFVDSASSFLCLACNVMELSRNSGKLKPKMPSDLELKLKENTLKAIDFLLKAKIDDRFGVRWQPMILETNPPGSYANIFFTNYAVLSLYKAIKNQSPILRWLDDRESEIEAVLSRVPQWIESLYEPSSRRYWLDSKCGQVNPATTAYALEILFTLYDELSDEQKNHAKSATSTLCQAIIDNPNGLQSDFYFSIPLPFSGQGTLSYDDRFYVGRLLSLLVLAKDKDLDVADDAFVGAGETLFRLLEDDWIDEPTHMWDDGRPLICFTKDALMGICNYSLFGTFNTITLKENELTEAVKSALKSSEVVSLIVDAILDKSQKGANLKMAKILSTARVAENEIR